MSQLRRGCHGVEVGGAILDLGRFTGEPLAEATVEFGAVAGPSNAPMWTQTGVAAGVTVERSLHRTGDAQFTLGGNRGPRISVDVGAGLVRVAPGDEFVQRQLVAAFALPLLLQRAGVLLLHASACARNGTAVIVCGESGAGKSSSLIALVDAGWAPISEDVCAVSFRDGYPVIWPGPPWVRVRPNEPGPQGAAVLAGGRLKTAWFVGGQQTAAPVPIRQLVLLSRGAEPRSRRQTAGEAIASVGPHAVWLLDHDAKGPQLFPLLARLSQVPVVELQLREEQAWRAALVDEFDQVAFS